MKRLLAVLACGTLAMAALVQAQNFGPGLRSVKMEAQDFQKSTAFYTALGMKAGTNRGSSQELVWEGTTQNSGILLVTSQYAQNAKMLRGGTYLMVMSPDVKAVADKLRKAGFENVAEPRAMGTMVSVLMLTDPDGNKIELMGPPLPTTQPTK